MQASQGADSEPELIPETALGHNGCPRTVLSDVTSRFPPEQAPAETISKAEDAAASSFQLQRRGRQPRACRSLLSGGSDPVAPRNVQTQGSGSSMAAGTSTVAITSSVVNAVHVAASSEAQSTSALRIVLRSSSRPAAEVPASTSSEAIGGTSEGQSSICTRRQARLNKQQGSSHLLQLSPTDAFSDDDLAVGSRSQRQGKAVTHGSASHSALSQGTSRGQVTGNDPQAGALEQGFALRRNRPRLQLNRKVKAVGGVGTHSQNDGDASAITASQL